MNKLQGPAFQPIKTTAWKEPALSLSKGCPTTRQLRRAGMTDREPGSKVMISFTNFKLATPAGFQELPAACSHLFEFSDYLRGPRHGLSYRRTVHRRLPNFAQDFFVSIRPHKAFGLD